MGPALRRGATFFSVIVLEIFGTYAEFKSIVGAYEIWRDGVIYKLHYHPGVRSKELLVTISSLALLANSRNIIYKSASRTSRFVLHRCKSNFPEGGNTENVSTRANAHIYLPLPSTG